MPFIEFKFRGILRDRPIGDRIGLFKLEGDEFGIVKQIEGKLDSSSTLKLRPRRGKYTLTVRVPGYHDYRRRLTISSESDPVHEVQLRHRCIVLPKFGALNDTQKRLIRSSRPASDPAAFWNGLSDNQATSFFQVIHAASQLVLANGRRLGSYIDSIYKFGGAKIVSDLPDGKKEKERTGWRQHIVIQAKDRGRIEADIEQGGIFGPKGKFVHDTHKAYGFKKSHRERDNQPSIQIVLNESNSHADLDLDVGGLHRSAPHVVYKRFSQRFPGLESIYRF